jgi:hypothetical protein
LETALGNCVETALPSAFSNRGFHAPSKRRFKAESASASPRRSFHAPFVPLIFAILISVNARIRRQALQRVRPLPLVRA